MDTVKNHPTTELLASYSAASLPLSQALCIQFTLSIAMNALENFDA